MSPKSLFSYPTLGHCVVTTIIGHQPYAITSGYQVRGVIYTGLTVDFKMSNKKTFQGDLRDYMELQQYCTIYLALAIFRGAKSSIMVVQLIFAYHLTNAGHNS